MKARALDRCMMEHRWGRRIAARQSLRLQGARKLAALKVLLNASLSGAYIATSATLRRGQHVTLRLRSPMWLSLSGFVVRTDESGFGLEWEVFASDSVRALLLSMVTRT